MKIRDFYRIPPEQWLFSDNPDVNAARRRAIEDPSANEESIEEYVRQWVLRELTETYGYPKEWLGERIVIEETVRMGSTEKQADISIKNSGRRTYLYVETKNRGVSQSAFDGARAQLESYLAATHTATIGMVTDGKRLQVLEKKIDPNEFNYIPEIPAYDKDRIRYKNILVRDITAEAADNESQRGTGLKPLTEALNGLLFGCHSLIRDIDGLHDDEALDELSKIIFTKIFDERDVCRKPAGTAFRFQAYGAGNTEEVASTIRALYDEARSYDLSSNAQKILGYERSRGVFKSQIRLSSNALARIVESLQEYSFIDTASGDLKGRAFQQVLGAAIRAGMGQFFTPDEVVSLIVEIVEPEPSDLILDPFCGSGHFLSKTLQYVETVRGETLDEYSRYDFRFNRLHGIEKSDRMVRIAMTDMMLHDDGHTNIRNTDALLSFDNYPDIVALGGSDNDTPAVFSKVLTNPPFGSIMQGEIGDIVGRFQLGRKKKSLPLEYLGLERCLQFLKPGGTLAIVLPDSVFNNRSAQFVRTWVMSQARLIAVVSLPTETFGPFGTMVKSSILFLKKYESTDVVNFDYPVFMGNIDDIGYDATGRLSLSQDRQEILAAWNQFKSNPSEGLSFPRGRAYITTAEHLKFRWDFKAGVSEAEEGVVPFSTYAAVVKETANLEKRHEVFPYLSISELPDNPFITGKISETAGNRLQGQKMIAKSGDVLFARLGPSMGNRKSLLVASGIERLYCSSEFQVIRAKPGIPPEFVLFLVKSETFVVQALSKARGATPSRLRLYADDLVDIQIPEFSDEQIATLGRAYLEGRTRAAHLIEEADQILQEVSPDF